MACARALHRRQNHRAAPAACGPFAGHGYGVTAVFRINLRGAVVPVVDLAARFGREPAAVTKRSCIVIIEVESGGERQDIGVVVDAVNEVLEIPSGDIRPAPSFGGRIRTDFIRGMGKVDGEFVVILDADHVLSVEELALLEEAGLASAIEAGGTEAAARA